MGEEIFRKKSIERINSPESLNDYVKVANPGVWILFVAVIILLVGVGVWGIFGRLETKLETGISVTEGIGVCTLSAEDCENVEANQTVRIGDTEGKVVFADKKEGIVRVQIDVPDGEYGAQIIIESISPFSFITN